MKHNSISLKVSELELQLSLSCKCQFLSHPDADKARSFKERLEILSNAIYDGCRCTLDGSRTDRSLDDHPGTFWPISAVVWLPNFQSAGLHCVLGLVENLAKLVALQKARKLMGVPRKSTSGDELPQAGRTELPPRRTLENIVRISIAGLVPAPRVPGQFAPP